MKPYYQDADVTLYHADCREVLPTIPDVSVDLVLTDPPYESEAHVLQRRINGKTDPLASYGRKVRIEPLPFGPIDEDLRLFVAEQFARVSTRWVLSFCQIESAPTWRAAYEAHKLSYKRTCIWVKPDGMPQYSGDRPGMGYEAFVAMHAVGRSRWAGGGRHGVFIENKGSDIVAKHLHPTQKPLTLLKDLVSLFSDDGGVVLDSFVGSGTTLVAAKELGRKAIGIELEEKYCEIAAKRLSQGVLPLFAGAAQ